MHRTKLLTGTLAAAILLGAAAISFVKADSTPHPALTGKVTSQGEGPMEGVIVGAKKTGSTITTWVVSNAQGQYSFPRDRMEAGKYAISVRAVGYELPSTFVDVTNDPAREDLQLNKLTSITKIALQLSNAEWFMSIPGTQRQKAALAACVTCHTVQKVMFSRFNAEEMTQVIQRMATHTNNSSLVHPWVRPATNSPAPAPTDLQIATAKYFSSINLSAVDTFPFPLKTIPRPRGKATQVIYTTYDLPRPDAAPHDTAMDAEGNVWYSDFTSQFIGKLDTKTGKVTEYPVPLGRAGPLAQGGLQIVLDREGRVYFGNMSQMQVARLDPKTGKIETFKPPIPEAEIGTGHLTMIDPNSQQVDGKIWVNIAEGTEESGGAWHVDLGTDTWTKITYPPGSPAAQAYDLIADSKNNAYGVQFTNDKMWITDGKTLQTTWWDYPTKGADCRRGHIDSQDRVWCGGFNGDDIAMYDPKTKKITEYKVPTAWTRPYDAEFDDKSYAWAAGMDSDIAVRLNTQTGEFTEYLLPHETNVRHVDVQETGALSSMWLGDQHGATIVHIEPLTP